MMLGLEIEVILLYSSRSTLVTMTLPWSAFSEKVPAQHIVSLAIVSSRYWRS